MNSTQSELVEAALKLDESGVLEKFVGQGDLDWHLIWADLGRNSVTNYDDLQLAFVAGAASCTVKFRKDQKEVLDYVDQLVSENLELKFRLNGLEK